MCHWVIVNQVGTCQGVLLYSLDGGVPLGYSQPGRYMSGGTPSLGGWYSLGGGVPF